MSEFAKKYLVVCICAVLASGVLLVYWQVRNFDFINYDDNIYVYENPHVLSGLVRDSVVWAFTAGHASNWHPNPGWMHLVNVLFHIANTLLLFTVLKRMTGAIWPSAFVAAAFALHPMHVESVAWIAERKDVLSTFFMLLTLAVYVSYVKRGGKGRYFLVILLFALGLMAKPMLVTLPFVLLLLDYWPLGRLDTRQTLYRAIIEKIPFFTLAVVSSVVTFLVQKSGGSVIKIEALTFGDRVANTFLSYARYMGKMFWPQDMAIFYPIDVRLVSSWWVVLCALLLAGVSIIVLWYWRTRKYLAVGWFWFVGTLVPVIGLVQVGGQAFADRYTYIPYIGLFIMIAWGVPELLSRWPHRKIALGVSAAVALAALGICAQGQVSYWKDSLTLYSHAVEAVPNNYVAYNNRGFVYAKGGSVEKGMEDFGRAIKIWPEYDKAYNNRGTVYYTQGRYQEAMKDYIRATEISPEYAEAYSNLGLTYNALGRRQEAVEAYKLAVKNRPDYAGAYNNLANVYNGLGRVQEAIEARRQAVRFMPDSFDSGYSLARELVASGRYGEAIEQYRGILPLKPDWAVGMNNLALIISTSPEIKDRNTDEAIRLASRACELSGYKNPVFLGTLAAAYASAGRFAEAVDTAKKAISLADAADQPQVGEAIRYHLSFYEQGRPYIER
jgi:tetratricopeptide (TPR) repeat protein